MRHRSVVPKTGLAALALLVGACGGGGGVGDDLDKVKGGGGNNAIGQATTTAAPATTAAPVATTAKAVTATTRAAQPNATFTIQDDTKGQYIEPLSHSVSAGSLVRFTNEDDIGHQITGKIGSTQAFQSPLIPPGGNYDVRPTTRGTIEIIDEQRTYAQGVTLTVR